jgi:hypothetical protein
VFRERGVDPAIDIREKKQEKKDQKRREPKKSSDTM